jgi:hypothetical protein
MPTVCFHGSPEAALLQTIKREGADRPGQSQENCRKFWKLELISLAAGRK